MVINGGSRAGAGELASHLARLDTNERMELREVRGLAADTLREGLRQMEGIAAGTRCKKSLYHANINSGPQDAPLTPEQQAQTIDRLEQRLGLEGHPRVVVAHVKYGRAHLHVVWSRIDQATMRAVSDSHNFRAHEQVARELEREFGHAQVKGAHDREDRPRPPPAPRSAELQQAARTKQDPARVTAEVTRLWRENEAGWLFARALDGADYVLAQGDRRGFCIVDQAGGVHSLVRRIDGATAKDVGRRLAGISLDQLPTVEQARAISRQNREAHEVVRQENAYHAALDAAWERGGRERVKPVEPPKPAPPVAQPARPAPALVQKLVPEAARRAEASTGKIVAPQAREPIHALAPEPQRGNRSEGRYPRPAPRQILRRKLARDLRRGAGRVAEGAANRAAGGFMGLVIGLIGRAGRMADRVAAPARDDDREKEARQGRAARPLAPPTPDKTPAKSPPPATPPRSAADELAELGRGRGGEKPPPRPPEPPRERERDRFAFEGRPGSRFLDALSPTWRAGWHVMAVFSRLLGLTITGKPRRHAPA